MRRVILPKSRRLLHLDLTTERGQVVRFTVEFDKSLPADVVTQHAKQLQSTLKAVGFSSTFRRFELMLSMPLDEFNRALNRWMSDLDSKLAADDAVLEELVAQFGPARTERSRLAADARPDRHTLEMVFDLVVTNEDVRGPSRSLFVDGHFASSILEAFKAVNVLTKQLSNLADEDGAGLMWRAFNPEQGPLRLNSGESRSDRDEQEGFMHIYAGVMMGIRNPKAHDVVAQENPIRTLQYLSLASLLATRAREATTRGDHRQTPGGPSNGDDR